MEFTTELSENVYRAWPLFDPELAATQALNTPDLGVLTIKVAKSQDPFVTSARVLQAALLRSEMYADGYQAALFLTEGVWQPNNRIIRYKKTWKMIAQNHGLGGLVPGAELLIESPLGIRFASLAAVNPSSIPAAFRLISGSGYYGFIVLGKGPDLLSDAFAREVYELSHIAPDERQKTERFRIAKVCSARCSKGELVVDCDFEDDGRYFFVQIFGQLAALRRLNII
jgi:hypothetical protein